MQQIYPSLHMLEIFMPVASDEDFLIGLLDEVKQIPFYKGLELPVLFKKENRDKVRKCAEEGYQITTWSSPNIIEKGYSLCTTDTGLREKSVAYAIELIKAAAETGSTNVGIPSGDDPGDAARPAQLEALQDSYRRMSEAAAQYDGLHLTFEPLDRYAHKKQILGPIREVAEIFAGLRKDCPNLYLHWDSAHEALATDISLADSLALALPYLAQFHICNCVNDPSHPCYGDWHMELGEPPEYKNWGYLNVEIAADMLRQVAQADTVEGVKRTHCAIEVRTHMGDDCWKREHEIRAFLMAAYDRAGLAYDR